MDEKVDDEAGEGKERATDANASRRRMERVLRAIAVWEGIAQSDPDEERRTAARRKLDAAVRDLDVLGADPPQTPARPKGNEARALVLWIRAGARFGRALYAGRAFDSVEFESIAVPIADLILLDTPQFYESTCIRAGSVVAEHRQTKPKFRRRLADAIAQCAVHAEDSELERAVLRKHLPFLCSAPELSSSFFRDVRETLGPIWQHEACERLEALAARAIPGLRLRAAVDGRAP